MDDDPPSQGFRDRGRLELTDNSTRSQQWVRDSASLHQPARESRAFRLYEEATRLESEGELGEALQLYRLAVKLDPHVDSRFHALEASKPQQYQRRSRIQSRAPPVERAEEEDESHRFPRAPFDRFLALKSKVMRNLQAEGDNQTDFVVRSGSRLMQLPAELLLLILKALFAIDGVQGIGALANCSRKWFLFVNSSEDFWRLAAILVWEASGIVNESKMGSWRLSFQLEPRLRFEGLYISRCVYSREGFSEAGWCNPVHFVTYYRFLRLFPGGRCVAILTHRHPASVVSFVRRQSPCYVGPKVSSVMEGVFRLEKLERRKTGLELVFHTSEQVFRQSLELKSTSRGRFNKLVWCRYYSQSRRLNGSGQEERTTVEYPLERLSSYYFSKVMSYNHLTGTP